MWQRGLDDVAPAAVQAKPKVSLFSFASPRVGNYTFGQTMRGTGPTPRVAVMRVVNKGDVVPLVPGARQVACRHLRAHATRAQR